MNSRERFFSMVRGESGDRRPFGALLSLYGAGLTSCPLLRYYNDAEAYAQGQDAVRQVIEPDFLTGPFMLAGYGEAFGSTLRYTDGYVPNLLRPAIQSASEIPTIRIPDVDAHPRLVFMRDAIRRLKQTHGNDAVIVAIALSPLDLPLVIMGLDAWLMTILTDQDATRRMLDITGPFFVRLCEAFRADGADTIVLPLSFFTRDIVTRHLASGFAVPVLKEALTLVKPPIVCHHTGSSLFDHIDLLDTLPNVSGFTLDTLDPLPNARKRVRSDTWLFAGLDGPSLHTLDPATIRTRCLESLVQMRTDGRFVPFATGTDVDLRTPVDHLLAIRRAVEEFGNG